MILRIDSHDAALLDRLLAQEMSTIPRRSDGSPISDEALHLDERIRGLQLQLADRIRQEHRKLRRTSKAN